MSKQKSFMRFAFLVGVKLSAMSGTPCKPRATMFDGIKFLYKNVKAIKPPCADLLAVFATGMLKDGETHQMITEFEEDPDVRALIELRDGNFVETFMHLLAEAQRHTDWGAWEASLAK